MGPEDVINREVHDPGSAVARANDYLPAVKEGRFPPNEKALAILKAMRERRAHLGFAEPGDSLRYLREARSGGMYGDESALPDR